MTKTLLAVEDSKTMQKVLDITFSGDEYEAVIAGDPEQALSRLDSVRPDMVLLDVTLGEANGYDLCQQIKSRLPGIPVMLLSSRLQPYDEARGAAVQVDDFIDKPFDTQQLREKVDKLCAASTVGMGRVVLPQTPVPEALAAAPLPPPVASAMAVPSAAPAPPPVRSAAPPRISAPRAAVATSGPSENGLAGLNEKLANLNLTAEQVTAVMALSREVIEQVVWEVVPVLAETLIKEEISRLTRE